MTQPPNQGPTSGWQQQPGQPGPGYTPMQSGYGPGSTQPPYTGFGPGGPRRPRIPLYLVVAIAGVLVLVGVVALIVPGLMGGDDDQSGPTAPSPVGRQVTSPQPTAQPSTPGGPRLTEATALATKFLAFLNANDQKHALALGCADSIKLLTGQLLVTIDPPTRLTVSGPAASVTSYYPRISVPFSGTTKGGAPLSGTVDIMDMPSQPLCVRLTSLAP